MPRTARASAGGICYHVINRGNARLPVFHADEHLLIVLRCVERNPLRAGLVEQARAWRWSSLNAGTKRAAMLHPGPVSRPAD